ncbi:cytochrome c [Flavobacterium sp. 245]|uniref:cytochrome c n=1 Tax=Flavobacterium sp. 245 TaxID=2512115 RepID=UPI00105C03B8|nr:cytochrome c [Flavobacterium sp. 245]TDP01656.1 diheme cytochrome c [Flavobacterium sp. 245]
MKTKILSLMVVMLLLASCGTKKTAVASAETPPVNKEVKAAELTPELAAGKNLYENSCAKCHKLYEPTKFSKEEWQPILVRMQKKAKLDDTNMASITNYIHSQL